MFFSSRNSVFLSQQISRNSVSACFFSEANGENARLKEKANGILIQSHRGAAKAGDQENPIGLRWWGTNRETEALSDKILHLQLMLEIQVRKTRHGRGRSEKAMAGAEDSSDGGEEERGSWWRLN